MDDQALAAALARATNVMKRRPGAGLQPDAAASARWDGGLRIVSRHANGFAVVTDMPTELGGSGEQVSPGWLVRAGLASCAATCIAIAAATEGIALDELHVEASSRSDLRGLLGIAARDGEPVAPGPRDIVLNVRLAARAASSERLHALATDACRQSPMTQAMERESPVRIDIDVLVDATVG